MIELVQHVKNLKLKNNLAQAQFVVNNAKLHMKIKDY